MTKIGILIGSLLAMVLLTCAFLLSSYPVCGGGLYFVGGVVAIRVWAAGLIKTAKRNLWGWFIPMLLCPPVTLLYGLFGPEPFRPSPKKRSVTKEARVSQ